MRRRAVLASAAVALLLLAGCGRSEVEQQLAAYPPERVAAAREIIQKNQGGAAPDDAWVLSSLRLRDLCGSMVRAVEDFSPENIARLRERAKAAGQNSDTVAVVEGIIHAAEQGDMSGMRAYIVANACEEDRAYG